MSLTLLRSPMGKQLSPFVDCVLERAKTDGGRGVRFDALCWVGNPAGKPPHRPDTVDTWCPSDLALFYVTLAVSKVW